ncbi:MAG: hypothetical protein K2H13_04175 [Eubacterium sp.]|nr:hypothetical protein [Eubacterium sp.]MDE6156302.1 hypothetical protein [Eubacterium sp.]MDE6767358.1 hypothetical protein [Eubacterium sp.]
MGAFGALFILEVVIVFSFVVTSTFMFVPKNNDSVHKIFFSLAIMLGVLVTIIDATALPSNFTIQIIMAWLGLVPSAIAVVMTVAKGKPNTIAKLLVMATSVYGALGYLVIF